MGWGASPADRLFLLGKAVKPMSFFPKGAAKFCFTMDGNATLRNYASAVKTPTSALDVARRVVRRIPNDTEKVVVVCFDDQSKASLVLSPLLSPLVLRSVG